jgi:beta-galactosidase
MWMNGRAGVVTAAIVGMLGSVLEARGIMAQEPRPAESGRRVVSFNGGWRFAKGEQVGAEKPGFDDSAWQAVRLPHDWAISGPFNPAENGYAGKLPWRGEGWYRKTFTLEQAGGGRPQAVGVPPASGLRPPASGQRVYFDFDGVMAFPKVYVNGQLAGQWDYGYMSFRVDATPYVKFGATNTIAVHVDTRNHGTRWYPGAGIYRKVTMTICSPVHVAHWGLFVTTPEVSDASATVRVRSTLENHLDAEAQVLVTALLLDPDGKVVGKGGKSEVVPGRGSREVEQHIAVTKPQRWDVDSPKLYTVRVTVRMDNRTVDTDAASFGIRTFQFTADDGFHLNGRRVQLYGVCLHHDQGPLGGAFYPRAMERQLEIMRDMGANAIRTSHNPPAPELLELCDRMGFVVWDEAFDKWDGTADRVRGEPPLPEYGERQLRNFVLRDRNHPSVVVWSIGNELGGGGRDGVTPERVKFMSDFVRKYDPTRPVGMGCHIPGLAEQPNFDALDLTGWNYSRRYTTYRQRYPDKPILYSESASALSTRGFYDFPLPNRKNEYSTVAWASRPWSQDHGHELAPAQAGDARATQFQVSSYDLNAADWSDIPDAEFKLMQDDRFVAGEFVWTGFDYLGEPTPFSQEAKSSYFGIVDLCGIPKDRFYLYRSYWRPETTTVHILPHWNWPDRVGQNVPVFVYTNGDSAELFLNGKSLGRRQKGVVPERPENFAQGRPATVGWGLPHQGGETPPKESVGQAPPYTAAQSTGQWWQMDLGEVRPIRYLAVTFEREEKNYGYQVRVSADASTWQTVVTKPTSRNPRWGGPIQIFHEVDAQARYIRIEFTELLNGVRPGLKEFAAHPQKAESAYYDVTYTYRLRWNDVVYEPGELKAVAYKDGRQIGEAVMRTAGKPTALRLTADRKDLVASGEDLCYILVEALDEKGTLCPLADDLIRFRIDGPAEIAAVGNGNPLSLEPFQADHRKLFYGKAMLILRTQEGQGGTVRVSATGEGFTPAETAVSVANP